MKFTKKKKKKYPFLDVLEEFKKYSDNYFIIIKESSENGQEITIASKEQKKKILKEKEI